MSRLPALQLLNWSRRGVTYAVRKIRFQNALPPFYMVIITSYPEAKP